jgi:hypothetical protein
MRRPPSFESLKGIPLLLPKCFQMEHEDGLLDWIFKGFDTLIDFESIFNQRVDIEILDDVIQLHIERTT